MWQFYRHWYLFMYILCKWILLEIPINIKVLHISQKLREISSDHYHRKLHYNTFLILSCHIASAYLHYPQLYPPLLPCVHMSTVVHQFGHWCPSIFTIFGEAAYRRLFFVCWKCLLVGLSHKIHYHNQAFKHSFQFCWLTLSEYIVNIEWTPVVSVSSHPPPRPRPASVPGCSTHLRAQSPCSCTSGNTHHDILWHSVTSLWVWQLDSCLKL